MQTVKVNDAVAEIQAIIGHGLKADVPDVEVHYINSLQDGYYRLGVLRGALGCLVRAAENRPLQDNLRKEIEQTEYEAYRQQVIDTGNAWADKYGDYHYVRKPKHTQKYIQVIPGKIVDADTPYTVQLVTTPTKECSQCGDTGWIVSYGSGTSKAGKYPCSCAKGNDKAKNTNYMGPLTDVPDEKELEQQALLKAESMVVQKIIQSGYSPYSPYSNVHAVPPEPPVVPERPEPKGRRFRAAEKGK